MTTSLGVGWGRSCQLTEVLNTKCVFRRTTASMSHVLLRSPVLVLINNYRAVKTRLQLILDNFRIGNLLLELAHKHLVLLLLLCKHTWVGLRSNLYEFLIVSLHLSCHLILLGYVHHHELGSCWVKGNLSLASMSHQAISNVNILSHHLSIWITLSQVFDVKCCSLALCTNISDRCCALLINQILSLALLTDFLIDVGLQKLLCCNLNFILPINDANFSVSLILMGLCCWLRIWLESSWRRRVGFGCDLLLGVWLSILSLVLRSSSLILRPRLNSITWLAFAKLGLVLLV